MLENILGGILAIALIWVLLLVTVGPIVALWKVFKK
jgi:hypothetical protein